MSKRIIIVYWHLTKLPGLKWEHNTEFAHSVATRTRIVNKCLKLGYSVMIRPADDGEIIWIDKGRFQQK